ncbi:Lysine-specific metallo-endopeptidase [Yoonia tamlensis]|uniref:Lysine-specific metallo-endopeptidase n=1 Tax=Yoonia tamlensis TaxID=390270 RepID=A0A1I6G8X1_9RHOB|nr:M35 family metallo-endopeptidase [Yoonia tamlensis]SFR38652.1 Lysine-specific metallo-endopeptidase [Yoonia tamlensis]
MLRICLVVLLILSGNVAVAENFEGCNKEQRNTVETAFRNAKALTLSAATAVGDTPEYERWFGTYSPQNAEIVRANLKSIVSAIRGGNVTAQCDPTGLDGCEGGTYAWVYPNEHYVMHLCPPFFTLPPLTALQPGARRSDNGTREGTIVHELSHFVRVADTDDHCYSRSGCTEMAEYDIRRAIDNADSYQYFTEDTTYYARQLVPGKPSSNN